MHHSERLSSRQEEAKSPESTTKNTTAGEAALVIWLLAVITPLVFSSRRGLSPGVVICFLLWVSGLIGIAAARRRGRSWDGGMWRYASFRLTIVLLLVVGQLLVFFGSAFSVAFFLLMAAAVLLASGRGPMTEAPSRVPWNDCCWWWAPSSSAAVSVRSSSDLTHWWRGSAGRWLRGNAARACSTARNGAGTRSASARISSTRKSRKASNGSRSSGTSDDDGGLPCAPRLLGRRLQIR